MTTEFEAEALELIFMKHGWRLNYFLTLGGQGPCSQKVLV